MAIQGQQLEQHNKTANINVKKLQFIHKLMASDASKTAKITKKVILLSNTLTFKQCAGWQYYLFAEQLNPLGRAQQPYTQTLTSYSHCTH